MNPSALNYLQSHFKKTSQPVKLVAVTKAINLQETLQVIEAGVIAIAENRIQVAEIKFPHLPPGIEKHFIGQIQSKKVKQIVRLFDVIQSIDSNEHLLMVDQEAQRQGKLLKVYLQFNISEEAQKFGYAVDQLEEIKYILSRLKKVQVVGVMGMASLTEDQELIRSQFKVLRSLRDALQRDFPSIKELSMGMSADYPIALEEGATVLRIGSLLFQSE